jgi:hypothetical protein
MCCLLISQLPFNEKKSHDHELQTINNKIVTFKKKIIFGRFIMVGFQLK